MVTTKPGGLVFDTVSKYEPKYPLKITQSPQDTLEVIDYRNDEVRYGDEIFFLLKKSHMTFHLRLEDPNVVFYLYKGNTKTKLSFSQMKDLVTRNIIKVGDAAKFTVSFQHSRITNNETLVLEQLEIFK